MPIPLLILFIDVKVSKLQSKIDTLEVENKLLKENFSNKQKLLEVFLEHNSALIKEKSKHVVNPNDKQVSLNKSTCDSQNHMGLDKSNGKEKHTKTIKNVRNNSVKLKADQTNNGAKANKKSVIIVGDSMIKNVIGRNISHSHTVKVHPNPGATTHDLMAYMETCHAEKAESPGDPYRHE